jgi:hypothetical protein
MEELRSIFDNVHKPSHYIAGREFEPKDVIRDWGLNFNLGNAVKYIARAGRKDDLVQDLRKAQEYIQFEIDAIEAEKTKLRSIHIPKKEPAEEDPVKYEKMATARVRIGCNEVEFMVPETTSPWKVLAMAIKRMEEKEARE